MNIACSQCGREFQSGETFFMETWRKCLPRHGDPYTPFFADMPIVNNYLCSYCVPGHIKRAALGITEIRGAASLTGRGE